MKIGLAALRRKNISEYKTCIAIDIGTENVKTVLFRFNESGRVEVLGYNRMRQSEFAMNKAIIMDVDEVANTLDQSLGAAISQAKNLFTDVDIPKQAVMGIAGELVTGAPIVVNVDRDDASTKISEAEVEKIVKKVKEYSFESTIEDISQEIGLKASQLKELSTVINTVSIDGARIKNPVGLSGSEISYRVFASFAPKIQFEALEQVAAKLKIELLEVMVEPYGLATALQGITNDKNGGIIIDIGAGTTDVAVVRDGEILGIKMFSIGGRVFTKRIEKVLHTDYHEAESLKIKHGLKKLDDYREREIKKVIENDIKSWLLGVELALEEMEDIEEFPLQMYICGGGALLPEIVEGVMSHPWIQRLNFKKHPKVSILYPNKLENVHDLTRTVTDPLDVTPLALAKSYVLHKKINGSSSD